MHGHGGLCTPGRVCTRTHEQCAHIHTHAQVHTRLHTCTHRAVYQRGAPARTTPQRTRESETGTRAPSPREAPGHRLGQGHAAPAGKASRSRSDPPSTPRGRPAPEASDLNLKTQRREQRRQRDVRTGPATGLEPWPQGRRGACARVVPRPHVSPAPTVPSAGPRPEVRGAYLPSSSSDSLQTTSISAESSEPFPGRPLGVLLFCFRGNLIC